MEKIKASSEYSVTFNLLLIKLVDYSELIFFIRFYRMSTIYKLSYACFGFIIAILKLCLLLNFLNYLLLSNLVLWKYSSTDVLPIRKIHFVPHLATKQILYF